MSPARLAVLKIPHESILIRPGRGDILETVEPPIRWRSLLAPLLLLGRYSTCYVVLLYLFDVSPKWTT